MRRILIDTDTGGDDAVALIMALREPSVKVEAVTTVMGNVNTEQATINALISIERAGTYAPPVYKGLTNGIINEPLVGKDYTIHGRDGMGDLGISAPKLQAEKEHAIDFLIRYIEENPGELELVTLGPVTNIASITRNSCKVEAHLHDDGHRSLFRKCHPPVRGQRTNGSRSTGDCSA